jgi:hypothetical protein
MFNSDNQILFIFSQKTAHFKNSNFERKKLIFNGLKILIYSKFIKNRGKILRGSKKKPTFAP